MAVDQQGADTQAPTELALLSSGSDERSPGSTFALTRSHVRLPDPVLKSDRRTERQKLCESCFHRIRLNNVGSTEHRWERFHAASFEDTLFLFHYQDAGKVTHQPIIYSLSFFIQVSLMCVEALAVAPSLYLLLLPGLFSSAAS